MSRKSNKHLDAEEIIRVEASLKKLQSEMDECNMIQHFFKHSLATSVLDLLDKVEERKIRIRGKIETLKITKDLYTHKNVSLKHHRAISLPSGVRLT
ncbi:hypothetical protein GUITHDRAFT_111284 [Guillardia theta CCMP2712]|uniref:Uncharacterized protein n=1 Tax=Guillardia theta (strain CCMP2712) TaxID=905079 RepID=L1J3C8_GUITC|nr:hypothetical protein GUITHDRAFT_111284 [Guillardia theta CCMP2712]EKX42600.1 hypothetical protein GUITHDRAFT_111284 [Guillardia theta CCMP2712]|eukprot:XP_005829580.1 hypothetical protein GUITHDRAFT_111284 [Guillardia theta CCMP2712]